MTDDQKAEWKRLACWKESELQELCCGFPRHEPRIAPDGPKRLRAELVDARDMIDRAVQAGELNVLEPGAGERSFRPKDATEWAAAKFPAFPFNSEDFPEDEARGAPAWPWGTHDTEWLQHLAAAAREWWATYDPADRTTAPTNRDVSDWLQKERGVGKVMADKMATILRADGLPTGPRNSS